MRQLSEVYSVQDLPEVRAYLMESMQYLFSKSQENLVSPMPWGDENRGAVRAPTVISDQGGILVSAIPPHWEGEFIVIEYPAPHSGIVEFGCDPHPVAAGLLVNWVSRKLGKEGKDAWSAAYAIANKIKKQGMPAHPYVRPAIHSMESEYGFSPVIMNR